MLNAIFFTLFIFILVYIISVLSLYLFAFSVGLSVILKTEFKNYGDYLLEKLSFEKIRKRWNSNKMKKELNEKGSFWDNEGNKNEEILEDSLFDLDDDKKTKEKNKDNDIEESEWEEIVLVWNCQN